jgi:hypothetical protein
MLNNSEEGRTATGDIIVLSAYLQAATHTRTAINLSPHQRRREEEEEKEKYWRHHDIGVMQNGWCHL